MNLARLPEKQKRLKHWTLLLEDLKDDTLRQDLATSLEAYKATLARCWKAEKFTPEDEIELGDAERRIMKLHDMARFAGIGSAIAEHSEK
jgi:hypothetical protein